MEIECAMKPKCPNTNIKTKRHNSRENDALSTVDHVVTSANSSQGESQLYIFEDHEAVINMIIKGRRPTMRHVSRTHKVALDWLFEAINLDPKSKTNLLTPKNNSHAVSRRRVAADTRTRVPEHRSGDFKARSGSFCRCRNSRLH